MNIILSPGRILISFLFIDNFIPESVDPSRRGVLEKAQEAYRLRLPSTFVSIIKLTKQSWFPFSSMRSKNLKKSFFYFLVPQILKHQFASVIESTNANVYLHW